MKTYKVGAEQFVVLVGTILATDLLIGIGVGIALEAAFHLWHGATVRCFVRADVTPVSIVDNAVTMDVTRSAVFSNWPLLRKAILTLARPGMK